MDMISQRGLWSLGWAQGLVALEILIVLENKVSLQLSSMNWSQGIAYLINRPNLFQTYQIVPDFGENCLFAQIGKVFGLA